MGLFRKKNKSMEIPNYNKLADNLYINNTEKKIIIYNNTFDFSDILDVKLVENGFEQVFNTKVGKSNLRVGHNKVLINQLDMEIKVNNIEHPFFNVPFLKLGIHTGCYKTSKKYKEAYQQLQYALSILEIIVKNNRQMV